MCKHLPHKCKEQSSIPRSHTKAGWVWEPARTPSTQEVRMGSLDKLASKTHTSANPVFSEKLCLINITCMHIYSMYIHFHATKKRACYRRTHGNSGKLKVIPGKWPSLGFIRPSSLGPTHRSDGKG